LLKLGVYTYKLQYKFAQGRLRRNPQDPPERPHRPRARESPCDVD